MYRNAFCVICNLGDEILSVNNERVRILTDGPKHYRFSSLAKVYSDNYKYFFQQPVYSETGIITIDLNEQECCYGKDCLPNNFHNSTASPWGYVKTLSADSQQNCIRLPFDTSCDDTDANTTLSNMSINFFCSGNWTPRWKIRLFPHAVPEKPSPVLETDPPLFSQFLFSDLGAVPTHKTYIIDSDWSALNHTLKLCHDGKVLDVKTNRHYGNFRLTESFYEVNVQ